MNKKQNEIIERIIKKNEKEFLLEFLDYFLEKGLGSVNKKETDIYLFFLLNKYLKRENKITNYEWSILLKISERKIKNLRLELGIRYTANETDNELFLWFDLLDVIIDGNLEFLLNEKVALTVENPYLLQFIDHKSQEIKTFIDGLYFKFR